MHSCLLLKIGEIGRLSASMKKLEKELKNTDKNKVVFPFWNILYNITRKFWTQNLLNAVLVLLLWCFVFYQNEQYRSKLQKSNERSLALVKAGLDLVVAVGLLQLAPKKVTPRVTGAFGFTSSLISCYQVFPLLHHMESAFRFYTFFLIRNGRSETRIFSGKWLQRCMLLSLTSPQVI